LKITIEEKGKFYLDFLFADLEMPSHFFTISDFSPFVNLSSKFSTMLMQSGMTSWKYALSKKLFLLIEDITSFTVESSRYFRHHESPATYPTLPE
jgi:hypothetical protein